MTISTDTIDQRVFIAAPPSRVWDALIDKAQFEKWFGVKLSGTMVEGATVDMMSPDCTEPDADNAYPVEILAVTPERELVWRWHPGRKMADIDYSTSPRTTVTFTLEAHCDGTMVTVVENGFDQFSDERRAAILCNNVNGWVHQAKSLQEYLK